METVPDFDLYSELEVNRVASLETIEAAWRSLMKRNHPDTSGSSGSDRSVRLNVAHDWLTDPVRRARFDEAQHSTHSRKDGSPQRAKSRDGSSVPPTTEPATPLHRQSLKLGGIAQGRPYRGGRDWRRVVLTTAAAFAVIGLFRSWFLVAALLNTPTGGEAEVSTPSTGDASDLMTARVTTTPRVSAGASASNGRRASSIPSTGPFSLSGAGNSARMKIFLTATVYRASYVVTSTKGGSCAWILFVTDTDGYEALMASAYPVDETIRDSETDTGLAVGAAVARVESDCPKWSASLTATGP